MRLFSVNIEINKYLTEDILQLVPIEASKVDLSR